MSKQRQRPRGLEDNRDVWDKVMDNRGAIIGAAVGAGLGFKGMRALNRAMVGKRAAAQTKGQAGSGGALVGAAFGAAIGGASDSFNSKSHRRK
jgi:hypothetical protein